MKAPRWYHSRIYRLSYVKFKDNEARRLASSVVPNVVTTPTLDPVAELRRVLDLMNIDMSKDWCLNTAFIQLHDRIVALEKENKMLRGDLSPYSNHGGGPL